MTSTKTFEASNIAWKSIDFPSMFRNVIGTLPRSTGGFLVWVEGRDLLCPPPLPTIAKSSPQDGGILIETDLGEQYLISEAGKCFAVRLLSMCKLTVRDELFKLDFWPDVAGLTKGQAKTLLGVALTDFLVVEYGCE